MGRLILVVAFVFIMLTPSCSQQRSKTDTLVFTEFDSKVLQEKRRIVVHLPLTYVQNSDKRYPVVYVLDAGKLDFDVADRLFTLASSDLAPECIVVGIINAKGARERDMTPPFMRTDVEIADSPFGKGDAFLQFIEAELIPRIDSTYRATTYRAIAGHSRSGLAVLYSLIEKPDLFNARFCFSTPAWRFDNVIMKRMSEQLRKHPLQKSSYLFFSVGEKENENIKVSYQTMIETLSNLKPKKLKWDHQFTPKADHQSNPVLSTPKALSQWGKYVSKEGINK